LTLGLVLVAGLVALLGASTAPAGLYAPGAPTAIVAPLALRDIPPSFLRLYEAAARRYGLDWAILAGIGKVECDHGRDPDPSCSREGSVNTAGAGGPMQFLASTWTAYGVDGDGDGTVDRWSPTDAIYSAAAYLRASGAPDNYRAAILQYNHANWYLAEVLGWAARYRAPGGSLQQGAGPGEVGEASVGAAASPTPIRFVAGDRAELAREDRHLALVPLGAPATVQAMVVAGNELQRLAYGPGGHPDPRGAYEEDCSSTVNYVLYRSGVRPAEEIVRANPLAQDYARWGAPGPGRWVTIYSTLVPTNHVFMVIAGLRLDTSHNGTDVGPNRAEDGPRWRVLERIPSWARWTLRHPPGL
jgi:hypothetical protein